MKGLTSSSPMKYLYLDGKGGGGKEGGRGYSSLYIII